MQLQPSPPFCFHEVGILWYCHFYIHHMRNDCPPGSPLLATVMPPVFHKPSSESVSSTSPPPSPASPTLALVDGSRFTDGPSVISTPPYVCLVWTSRCRESPIILISSPPPELWFM